MEQGQSPRFEDLLELLYGSLLDPALAQHQALRVSERRPRPAWSRRLSPHLENTRVLQQRLHIAEQMASGFDVLSFAAWILDRDCAVLHANEGAIRLLEHVPGFLRNNGGRLSPIWKEDRAAFLRAISGTAADLQGPGDAVVLHDPDGQPSAFCSISRVPQGGYGCWLLPGNACVLLVLTPINSRASVPADLLHQAYGLTRAEAQLAHALLEHGSLAACCKVLGKSRETLRTQLKALFAKTGTHRQAELALKLQALAS